MKKYLPKLLFALIVPIQSSFAQQPSVPAVSADNTQVANPPAPIEPDMKGYGTRGVEGRTLSEMLDKCRSAAGSMGEVEKARCDQLRRTVKNQPGNAAGS